MSRLPIRHPGENTRHYALRMARRPLRRVGYDIQRVDPNRRETLEQALQHLARAHPRPATVIDVGVATGTPELYSAFPEACFLLVEAQAENEPHLRRILEQVRGEYVLAAVTSGSGTVELRVSRDPAEWWGSTICGTGDAETEGWDQRSVPTVRLDELVSERGVSGPFVIKADTEGRRSRCCEGGGDPGGDPGGRARGIGDRPLRGRAPIRGGGRLHGAAGIRGL